MENQLNESHSEALKTPGAYDEMKIQIRKEIASMGKNFENDWFFVTAYMIERGIPKEFVQEEMEKANFQQIQMLYMIKSIAEKHNNPEQDSTSESFAESKEEV